jgi:hypothetical protein
MAWNSRAQQCILGEGDRSLLPVTTNVERIGPENRKVRVRSSWNILQEKNLTI